MRGRAVALIAATTAVGILATTGSAAAGQGDTFCTWGGTPAAPTGIITLNPGITNTPSTGPIQFTATGPLGGSGCTGKLTFTGSFEPGATCDRREPASHHGCLPRRSGSNAQGASAPSYRGLVHRLSRSTSNARTGAASRPNLNAVPNEGLRSLPLSAPNMRHRLALAACD